MDDADGAAIQLRADELRASSPLGLGRGWARDLSRMRTDDEAPNQGGAAQHGAALQRRRRSVEQHQSAMSEATEQPPRENRMRPTPSPKILDGWVGVENPRDAHCLAWQKRDICVLSSVDMIDGVGPMFHLSIHSERNRPPHNGEVHVVLRAFGLLGAEEDCSDNDSAIRHFWKPVRCG